MEIPNIYLADREDYTWKRGCIYWYKGICQMIAVDNIPGQEWLQPTKFLVTCKVKARRKKEEEGGEDWRSPIVERITLFA